MDVSGVLMPSTQCLMDRSSGRKNVMLSNDYTTTRTPHSACGHTFSLSGCYSGMQAMLPSLPSSLRASPLRSLQLGWSDR